MDFSFTEEQRAMADMLEKFQKTELYPNYMKWDREEKFDRATWKKMADLGLVGMNIPVEYGGQGADAVTMGLVTEITMKGDFNTANGLLNQWLDCEVVSKNGNEKMKEEWLPQVAAAEKMLGIAITEAHCGTDAGALRSTAVKKGDKYILNGEKSGITFASLSDAFIIFARTEPKKISAFLMRSDLPGVTIQTYKDMGNKPLLRGSIFMEDVEIPADCLIGKDGEGFKQCMKGFDLSRTLLGIAHLGALQITLEETIAYLKERTSFGKAIIKNQGVAFPLADYWTRMESARNYCYRALWLRDQGLPHTREAAQAKMLGSQLASEAIHACILLHGHYGYTQEFPVEQRLRDVIGLEIGDGTPQASLLVIATDLFGREFRPY